MRPATKIRMIARTIITAIKEPEISPEETTEMILKLTADIITITEEIDARTGLTDPSKETPSKRAYRKSRRAK